MLNKICLLLLLPFFLTACWQSEKNNVASQKVAIIDKASVDCTAPYQVVSGDKLALLAWQCHIGIDTLANINGLKISDRLTVGQVLYFSSSADTHSKQKVKDKPTKKITKQKTIKAKTTRSKTTKKAKAKNSRQKNGHWQMPVQAKIAKPFSKNQKGIAFATKAGEAVVSVADGKVIYSGSKLLSYGHMIIIKHKDSFYSAYTRNERVMVQEGDTVLMGDKIALTGAENFYFEFRKKAEQLDFSTFIK